MIQNLPGTKGSNHQQANSMYAWIWYDAEYDKINVMPKDSTQTQPIDSGAEQTKHGDKKHFKNKLNSKSAMLHTYRQDVEGLVKKRKVSLINAMAMQMDKTGKQSAKIRKDGSLAVTNLNDIQKQQNTKKIILGVSVVMLILGIIAIIAAYSAYQIRLQQKAQDKANVLTDDTMIFIEHRARLNVTDRLPREILANLTQMLKQSQATLGSITQILLEWSVWSDEAGRKITFTIDQAQLIKLLGLSLSDQFIRLLGAPNKYMIGMHMADRNTPFILLTTQSFEHAFANMLEWERNAENELKPLFSTNGSGSSKRTVEDIVVKNIDARAIRDDARNLKLLYAFLDKNTILITNNIHTLTEVARRYKVRKASNSANVPPDFIQ